MTPGFEPAKVRIINGQSTYYLVDHKVTAAVVFVKLIGGGHRVPPAGLPIEQVLGEYSLSFLRRDVALFVSTRARDSL